MAQAFYDTADEATRDWLANVLFYRELESIRRDKSLLDPSAYPVASLELYDRERHHQQQEQHPQQSQMEKDQEDGMAAAMSLRGGARSGVLLPFLKRARVFQWFFTRRLLAKQATVLVLDGDDDDDDKAGQAPPEDVLLATNLDIPSITRQIGYTQPFEKQFPIEVEAAKTTEHKNGATTTCSTGSIG